MKDYSKKCENKHTYFEGGMQFYCCTPHCKEDVEAGQKRQKISKKDN